MTAAESLEALRKMLKRSENRACADCDSKQPRWASINLGCFICIRCSGIHRSIGTHISKVRSVTLDEWKSEWIENMKAWGNKKVNSVWEATMPPNRKPNTNTADKEMEAFIRDKYERKMWLAKAGAKADAKRKPSKKTKKVETSEDESSSEEESSSEDESSDESSDDSAEKNKKKKQTSKAAAKKAPEPKKESAPKKKSSKHKATKAVEGEMAAGVAAMAPFGSFESAPVPVSATSDFGDFGDWQDGSAGASFAPASAPKNDKHDIMSLFAVAEPPAPAYQPQMQQQMYGAPMMGAQPGPYPMNPQQQGMYPSLQQPQYPPQMQQQQFPPQMQQQYPPQMQQQQFPQQMQQQYPPQMQQQQFPPQQYPSQMQQQQQFANQQGAPPLYQAGGPSPSNARLSNANMQPFVDLGGFVSAPPMPTSAPTSNANPFASPPPSNKAADGFAGW